MSRSPVIICLVCLFVFISVQMGISADSHLDESPPVQVLTSSNFDSYLSDNPIVFVMFFAPWCYWSKLAVPEFEAASQLLSHHKPPVKFAKIDTTEYQGIGRHHGIIEYPTLRLYLEGMKSSFLTFTENRHRAQMVHWLDRHLNKDKAISTTDHLDALLKNDHQHLVVIAVFPTSESTADNDFMEVAREFGDNIIFAHTNDPAIKGHLETKYITKLLKENTADVRPAVPSNGAYVALFSPHAKEDRIHLLEGIDKKSLRQFVLMFEFPAVLPFTLGRASRLFEEARQICVLVIDTSKHAPADILKQKQIQDVVAGISQGVLDDATNHAHHLLQHEKVLSGNGRLQLSVEEDFRKVAQRHRGSFLFTISGNTEPHEKRLMNLLGIEEDAVPALRIVTFNPAGTPYSVLKFQPEDSTLQASSTMGTASTIDEAYITHFIESFLNKEIQPFFKSEAVAAEIDNKGPVKTIVGKNYQQEVLESLNDVFVDFYAPWCGHCRKMEPDLKELAVRLKSIPGIVIAKIDATRNEVNNLSFAGYPTLAFFSSDKKSMPSIYHGNRSVEDMMRWIGTKATVKFNADDLLSAPLVYDTDMGEEL